MFISTLTPGAPLSLFMIARVEMTSTRVAVNPPWSVPPLLVCSSSTRISHTTLPGLVDKTSTWETHRYFMHRDCLASKTTGLQCMSLPYLKFFRSLSCLPSPSWFVLLYLKRTRPYLQRIVCTMSTIWLYVVTETLAFEMVFGWSIWMVPTFSWKINNVAKSCIWRYEYSTSYKNIYNTNIKRIRKYRLV